MWSAMRRRTVRSDTPSARTICSSNSVRMAPTARVADEEPVAVALLPVDGDQRRLLAEDRESTRQPWQDADSLTGTSAGLGRVRGRRVQSGSRHLLGGRDLRAEVAVRHAGAVASWSRRVDAVIGLSG